MAENLDDHALAVAYMRRKTDHFDYDFVVRLGALCTGIADVERVSEHFAVDLHQPHATLHKVGADESVGGPLDDIDNAAFKLPHAAFRCAEPNPDGVAANGVAGRLRGNKDVGIATGRGSRALGPNKAKSGVRATKRANDVFGRLVPRRCLTHFRSGVTLRHGTDQVARAVGQLAFLHEGFDRFFQPCDVVVLQPQLLGNHLRLGRPIDRVVHVTENGGFE